MLREAACQTISALLYPKKENQSYLAPVEDVTD